MVKKRPLGIPTATDRVMKSVVSWLERKLFLKVNASKTRITRPTKSKFLGFTFWKSKEGWKAAAKSLSYTFRKLNQVIRGWINYFKIGSMKAFLKEFGEWMRHKVRVIIIKQWKKS